jgi:hypothetical protein
VVCFDLTLAPSVSQMKCWDEGVIGTIEPACGDAGNLGIGHIEPARIGKRVKTNHVAAHVVRPLDDLWADADHIGTPDHLINIFHVRHTYSQFCVGRFNGICNT